MGTLEEKQRLYDSIKDVIDLPTRRILYIQFVGNYYPEAFKSISSTNIQ